MGYSMVNTNMGSPRVWFKKIFYAWCSNVPPFTQWRRETFVNRYSVKFLFIHLNFVVCWVRAPERWVGTNWISPQLNCRRVCVSNDNCSFFSFSHKWKSQKLCHQAKLKMNRSLNRVSTKSSQITLYSFLPLSHFPSTRSHLIMVVRGTQVCLHRVWRAKCSYGRVWFFPWGWWRRSVRVCLLLFFLKIVVYRKYFHGRVNNSTDNHTYLFSPIRGWS